MYFLIILEILFCGWSRLEGHNIVQDSLAYLKVRKLDDSIISHYCYAIFIKPNLLLTAASCLERSASTEIVTLQGAIGRVAYALNHPDFRDDINYQFWGTDIAVLKLKTKVNMKKNGLKLLKLPTKPPDNNANCIIYDQANEEEFIIQEEMCVDVLRRLNSNTGMCMIHSRRKKRQIVMDNTTEDTYSYEDYSAQNDDYKDYNFVQDCGILKSSPIMCDGIFTSIASDGNCTNADGITFVPNLYELLHWIDFADRELNDNAARNIYKLFFQQYRMKNGTREIFVKVDRNLASQTNGNDLSKHFNHNMLILYFIIIFIL